MDNIILVGFMASGKSRVGGILSRLSGLPLVDADSAIVERAGKSIEQIFADKGEAAFRALERQVIAELCGGSMTDYLRRWRGLCGPGANRRGRCWPAGRCSALTPGRRPSTNGCKRTGHRARRRGRCWPGMTRWAGYGSYWRSGPTPTGRRTIVIDTDELTAEEVAGRIMNLLPT